MTIRVLIADDHTIVLAGIKRLLETSGEIQVVAEAKNGQEAMQQIEEFKPDVALLDIQMPKASGIEVTRWIREQNKGTRVVILTAYDDDPYIQALFQAGADGYLLKTSSPAEVLKAVKDVHSGKRAVGQEIATKLVSLISNRDGTGVTLRPLTNRETQILELIAKGYTNKAVGADLNISHRTVQTHLTQIYKKLRAKSRTEAVLRGISLGYLPKNIVDLISNT